LEGGVHYRNDGALRIVSGGVMYSLQFASLGFPAVAVSGVFGASFIVWLERYHE